MRIRKIATAGLAVFLLSSAGTALADSASSAPTTSEVTKTVSWGGDSSSAKIRGNKLAVLSSKTENGTWTNQASFSLSHSGKDGAVRGSYGYLVARTDQLIYNQMPGGRRVPAIRTTSSAAETSRTKGKLSAVAKTELKIGTSQRNGWTRDASVCMDVVLRPDSCSTTLRW